MISFLEYNNGSIIHRSPSSLSLPIRTCHCRMFLEFSCKNTHFQAYDRRFPTCPQIPYLMETEILEETTTADGAVTVTERKLQTMVPQLIQDVSGAQFLYFNQKMATDRRNRVMTVETRNISFTGPSYPGKVHFTETSKYYVSFFIANDEIQKLCQKVGIIMTFKFYRKTIASVFFLTLQTFSYGLFKFFQFTFFFQPELFDTIS